MSSTQHISQEHLILYSMQALSPTEQDEAKAHLETCAACRSALAEVLADVSLIGSSPPQQELPEGAHQSFTATIANTPSMSSEARQPAPETPNLHSYPIRGRRQKGGLGWFGWITALAALAVAVYLSVHSLHLVRQLNADQAEIARLSLQAARAHELMDALTSPAAWRATLTETRRPAQPVGHAAYLKESGGLIFIASNLHPVPQSKTYELWLMPANGKAPIPAGLFRPDSTGSASVVLPPLPAGVEARSFRVTVEPAHGSFTPTLPIVMSGQQTRAR